MNSMSPVTKQYLNELNDRLVYPLCKREIQEQIIDGIRVFHPNCNAHQFYIEYTGQEGLPSLMCPDCQDEVHCFEIVEVNRDWKWNDIKPLNLNDIAS